MALTATDEHQHTIIVTKEFVRTICELLDERRQDTLSKELHDVHSADMADLVEALDEPHREALFDLCYSKFDVAVLVNLESPFQQWMVEHLGVQTTAKMLATLDTVSALDIVETLDEELQANLFSVLTKEQRAQIKEGLSFPENSAGRLMQRELIALPGHWTAQQAATYIRQSETLPKYIYKLYVIDKHHRPVGALTLKEIITADSKQPLNELVDEEMHPLHLDTPQRDVLYAFRQYALTACPVVDDQDRLVGIVTIDDVVDVIDEEAEKELYVVSLV